MKALLAGIGKAWLSLVFVAVVVLAWLPNAHAVTYANVAVPFAWIDASAHTKVGYNTIPYKFNGGGGCGTNPPTLDDTLSDNIPLGFTFMYGGQNFTQARIMSNGRLQFNNNTTCSYGSPVTVLPYPDASLNYTMRIYGNDLDPTAKSEVPAYSTACLNRGSCYISYATLGTAPYRSFVVTWSNVPEWAAGGSTSGNYNLQVILQENGEFIYQYGANTPGPGNTTAQVGWQVDSGSDYDIPAVGYPASNSAIKFYIPRPVAEYRMEQPSWNGTAGEVLDTSGNARHATALQAGAGIRPQDVAGGRVCRGGQIAHNTTTADISAISTPITIPTTVGSVGTISFWYNNTSNSPNITRLLFDATTVNNRFFYLQRTSNGALTFLVTDSGNTNRTATTANSVLPATGWSHIAVSWNFNNLAAANSDRLRIWVDGVLLQTSAFSTGNVVSPQIGTLYIGDNRSNASPSGASAGSPGGAIATLDEFRIYNYEGGLALVQRDMNQTGACLAHYAISHAGTARACDENNVTITAHDATHGLVTMPNNTTQITLSTSTGKGDWTLKNGYGVLSNGTADDGIATYLFNGEYQAVFGLTHTTPATVNINVTDGQIAELEDPALILTSCVTIGRINGCHDYSTSQCKATGRLNTRLAGVAFATDVVALDTGGNMDSSFTGKAVVSLIARATPGGVDANNCFVPDWTQMLDNAATAFIGGKLTVNVTVANAWRDVRIKAVCDAVNCPPAGVTSCSTDNFAIRPSSFTVLSSNANADATGTSTSATPALKAGTGFNLTATAVAGYGGTPLLDSTKVFAHAGALATGNLGGGFGAANSVTGTATGAAFSYTEVGYLGLNAAGVYDDSFTSVDQSSDCTNDFSNTAVGGKFGCKFGNTAATAYFGRFIPDHFDTEVTHACVAGGFTYSGQPFPLKVTAKNSLLGTTANYTGGFAKTVTLADANGAAGAFTPATLVAGDFTSGVADKTVTPSVSFAFATKPAAPATLKVRGTDTDAVTSAGGAEGTPPIRSGRLRIINTNGSELLPARVEYRAEYWDGNRWTTNTSDACTSLSAGNIATGGLAVNSLTAINAGVGFITFNAAAAGSYDIAFDLNASGVDTSCNAAHGGAAANKLWLQGRWSAPANCGGVAAWAQDPNARVRLGSPKAPYIYMRERY